MQTVARRLHIRDSVRVALRILPLGAASQGHKVGSQRRGSVYILGPTEDVYIVVDQLNALELDGLSTALDDAKKRVTRHLGKMQYGHKYIFSVFANEKSYQVAAEKQSGVTVIPMNGGMTEVRLCSHDVAR
jgi:hypothetical protein